MSLELPGWVVDAFYFVGLPWPGVDEDELHGWAGDLRQFADEITMLSGLSHSAIQDLAHSDQSAFVATMAKHWDHHHAQIKTMREPLHVFARALDIAGDAVKVQKEAVIAAAITLAGAVIATQGEALVTFGIAEGEVPLEVEAAKKIINFALQELENKLLSYLINKAAAELSSHLNGTISKLLMGGLGVANEAYTLKTDTKGLRALAKTINTHARRTESTSDAAYRRSTNRKIETESKGGRWHVAQILEEALLAVARDIFRHLPGTLHQVMEDTEKDLTKAAVTIEQADAELANQALHGDHRTGSTNETATDSGEDPSEAQEQPKDALDGKISALRAQGHAPGRHLDPEVAALERRLGTTVMDGGQPKIKTSGPNVGHVTSINHVDPLTGTTTDGETGGPHRCGPYATKFNDPQDMATIDEYCRQYIAQNGSPPGDIPIATVLGPDGHQRFTGVYKDPTNPDRYLPVDFEGGTVFAKYRNENGEWKLRTMFPNPRPGRHP